MYYLQENQGGAWYDIYTHKDYNYLCDVCEIFRLKHPNYKYRVIEVIERV